MIDQQKITRFVGIDAGVNTGLAVWNSDSQTFLTLKTLNFFDALLELLELQKQAEEESFRFAVIIEDPNGNSPTFGKFDQQERRVRDTISQRIGSNKRDAILISNFCQLQGFESFLIVPSKKSLTKLTKSTFAALTKFEGLSSQHARDAGGLVFGMTSMIRRSSKAIVSDSQRRFAIK